MPTEKPTDSQPQLKDQAMYDALRREGNSKEKSARISNAAAAEGRSDLGSKGGHSGSYEDWTVDELRSRAKELDLHGYSDLRKDELVEKLRDH
nr:Rho termination factor N-terminal domain-containing protein [Rhodococcus sp. (in: high G+C Gram-positive bacteria)]